MIHYLGHTTSTQQRKNICDVADCGAWGPLNTHQTHTREHSNPQNMALPLPDQQAGQESMSMLVT